MYKNVTLNEFIAELQKLQAEHGDKELKSIGACSGKLFGLSSPFCLHFEGDRTEYVPAYQQDVKPVALEQVASVREPEGELRHIWARVGMTLDITPDEEKAIFEGDYLEGKAVVKRVVMDGRASLDGETYIPEECIQDFDDEYGTNYRDREDECAWTMDGEYVNAGGNVPGPCKLGDSVFVLYYNEENGKTEIDELKVAEVSQQRIWVAGDDGFDYRAEDIGKSVFLSREAAEVYIQSPEYLAERVNMVLHLNVSDNAKREFLVASFAAGQEYFEKDTGRYIQLTAKGPFDVWKYDVFDKNHELLYGTDDFAASLAIFIMSGHVVPAYTHEQEQLKIADVIADAKTRVEHEPARGQEETLGL